MLSSVANRAYWMARYLERAENTARLVQAYTNLLLDLPTEVDVGWEQLVQVSGAGDGFEKFRTKPLERSVVLFLVAEKKHPGSILHSIRAARENLRTLREIVPKEAFETLNELYLYSNKNLARAASTRFRFEILGEVIQHCQQITGLLAGTMSQNAAYDFIRLGRNLERADMTTRMLDVGGDLMTREASMAPEHQTTMWVNVLRSLSAYQAYRQSVQSRITSVRVLYFLLANQDFPRTLTHCLNEARDCALRLPHNEEVVASVEQVRATLSTMSLRGLARENLHNAVDQLQLELINVHDTITHTWMVPKTPMSEAS